MMKEELAEREYKRIEECDSCNNCLCWHKHCQAECCKVVKIFDGPGLKITKKYVEVHKRLTPSEKWYYELRGCRYVHGILKFPLRYIVFMKGYMWYVHPCQWLKGNLCIGHSGRRPKLCGDLTLETVGEVSAVITPNCLFKYKRKDLYKGIVEEYTNEDLELFESIKGRG